MYLLRVLRVARQDDSCSRTGGFDLIDKLGHDFGALCIRRRDESDDSADHIGRVEARHYFRRGR